MNSPMCKWIYTVEDPTETEKKTFFNVLNAIIFVKRIEVAYAIVVFHIAANYTYIAKGIPN